MTFFEFFVFFFPLLALLFHTLFKKKCSSTAYALCYFPGSFTERGGIPEVSLISNLCRGWEREEVEKEEKALASAPFL